MMLSEFTEISIFPGVIDRAAEIYLFAVDDARAFRSDDPLTRDELRAFVQTCPFADGQRYSREELLARHFG